MAQTPMYATTLKPAIASIAQTTDGLLGSDDFNRGDEELSASGWTEDQADWEVVSNRMTQILTTNGERRARFTTVASRNKVCIQGVFRRPTGGNFPRPGILNVSVLGYLVTMDSAGGFELLRDNATSLDGPTTQGSALDTDHAYKLMVDGDAPTQDAWFNDSAAAGDHLSATDSTYVAAFWGGAWDTSFSTSVAAQYDDLLVMIGNDVTMTGMTTGHKLRVTWAAGTVTATESSGTAVVDADYRLWPATLVEVLNASDTVVATSGAVTEHGGAIWAFSAGAGNDAHIGVIDSVDTYTDDADTADPPANGNAYTMSFLTQPFDVQEPGLEGWLTEITQNVEQIDGATILIEILANEADRDAPTETKTVTLVTGDPLVTRFPFRARGSQVRLKITISGFSSRVELGKMDLWKFGRRMGQRRRRRDQ